MLALRKIETSTHHPGATDPLFPFGFVQLGPNQNNTHSYNWPIVRSPSRTPNTLRNISKPPKNVSPSISHVSYVSMKPLRRRWKQTAEQGYVPNSVLENVFMAAAMDDDMGDYHAGKYLHL